jgi:UDP-sulfoquinovose synthase
MVRCVELDLLHPPRPGELRVFNQFTEQWSIGQLAGRVRRVAASVGLDADVVHLANPRIEAEAHYYHAAHSALLELGLEPHLLSDETIFDMLSVAMRHRDRIRPESIPPQIEWRGSGAVRAQDAREVTV